eukprot:SAG11_NODE_8_length_31217_cov_52.169677_10_plen_59_part_00
MILLWQEPERILTAKATGAKATTTHTPHFCNPECMFAASTVKIELILQVVLRTHYNNF